jgi:hypothetical protein
MSVVVLDKQQRANLARSLQSNALLTEILADLRRQQVDVFLQGRPLEEVREAQAIAKAIKMVEDRITSVLLDERLMKRQQERSQHRNVD